jgi:hypothetical protein
VEWINEVKDNCVISTVYQYNYGREGKGKGEKKGKKRKELRGKTNNTLVLIS